jgi:hypothetical protein
MAEADLAALDAVVAERHSRKALEADSALGEAWYMLANAIFDTGRAEEALVACRKGLERPLTPAQRETLAAIERLLARRR